MGGWSNKRMGDPAGGTSNMSHGASRSGAGPLDPATAALVRLAAAVAAGDVPELQQRLAAAQAAGVPPLWIDELLLQSMLVVGYPLALVAFGVWREVGGAAAAARHAAEPLAHVDWQAWADRGAAVCREGDGRAYRKLVGHLRALHPALEDLGLVDAYGKVIGRPGLDLKRRERATVAAIAVLGTAQQLHAHLRGALNTGASPEEAEAGLEVVAPDLDPGYLRSAAEQWAGGK